MHWQTQRKTDENENESRIITTRKNRGKFKIIFIY